MTSRPETDRPTAGSAVAGFARRALAGARSLRVRITLLFLCGLAFAMVNFSALLGMVAQGQLARELDHQAEEIVLRLSNRAAPVLASGNRGALLSELARFAGEPDVVAVAVYDAAGRRIAVAGASGAALKAGERLALPARPAASWNSAGPGRDAGLHDAVARVPRADGTAGVSGGSAAGFARVVLDGRSHERPLQSAMRFGYALMGVILIIGLFASLLMTQIVVQPLREASDLATRIATGRLDARLPVRGSDELGSLAASLNRMAASLQTAQEREHAEATRLRTLADAAGAIAQETQVCEDPARAFEIVAGAIARATGFEAIALADPVAGTGRHRLGERHPRERWADVPAGADLDLLALTAGREWARVEPADGSGAARDVFAALRAGGMRHLALVPLPTTTGADAVLLLATRGPEPDAGTLRLALELGSHLPSAMHAARLRGSLKEAFEKLAHTQEQLIRSEKMRATGEMASGIAHDFNNVLGAILARIQLLRRGNAEGRLGGDDLDRSLGVMETAARDGAETVRRLRHLSTGDDRTRVEPCDLGEVVRDAWEFARLRSPSVATEHSAPHAISLALATGAWVLGNPAQLREVFTNLILNAQDAMPDGGALRLEVRVENGRVLATVEDTGVGMPPDVQRRIFDPFYTTKGVLGTGLGLSVVYGIVQRHAGTLQVRSAPGEGTRFDLGFPLGPPPARDASGRPQAPEPAEHPLRVMVVDDQESVRTLLADVVREAGDEAEAFDRAEAALAAFEDGDFDLVFSDLGMPGLTGWEFVRLIRERDALTPVVFVTGWGDEVEPERARAAGADAVIAKPFSIEDIAAVLAQARERRDRRTAA